MGSCLSCFTSTEPLGFPNETSHLLSNIEDSIDQPQTFQEPQVIESLEKHKAIVQKAAENLIDISSTRILDRVQTDIDKANEYRDLLKEVEISGLNIVNPLRKSNVQKDTGIEQKMSVWISDLDNGVTKIGLDLDHLKSSEYYRDSTAVGTTTNPVIGNNATGLPSNGLAGTSARMGNVVPVQDGVLVIREMKDDNSCLFRSIAYVLEKDVQKHSGLRKVIADYILDHPMEYPEVILGRDPVEYCTWIRNLNSWGGAIELSIFSEIYKTGIIFKMIQEIDSIDISTLRVDRFGQDKYDSRVLVLYSGIHYDVIALSPSIDAPMDFDMTCFSTLNSEYVDSALELAKKLKAQHKYTDLANFTLKCGICFQGLRGQAEAQKHAMSTGHKEFTEYE